jgi:hypothetical protein
MANTGMDLSLTVQFCITSQCFQVISHTKQQILSKIFEE